MSDPMLPEGFGVDPISLFQPSIHPLRDAKERLQKDSLASESNSEEIESRAVPDVLEDDRWQPNSAADEPEDYGPRWMRSVAQNGSGRVEYETSVDEAASGSEQILNAYFRRLEKRPAWRWHGRVIEATGQTI